MDDWEVSYEKERNEAFNKIRRSSCSYCKYKCNDVDDYTMGENYNNKWVCFDCVPILHKSLGVKNTSEFWQKTGYYY